MTFEREVIKLRGKSYVQMHSHIITLLRRRKISPYVFSQLATYITKYTLVMFTEKEGV